MDESITLRDLCNEAVRERVAGRDPERVLLRLVAHVERVLDADRLGGYALVGERRSPLGLEQRKISASDVRSAAAAFA